jgi:four helix bundle protein
MSDFKRLLVWRKAHALALNVHRSAARIRGSQYASLRSQMIRAAMSIPTNIVEGRGQQTEREFGRFLRFALNSSSELEYHLIVACDMRVLARPDVRSLLGQVVEVRRMLCGLLDRLQRADHGARGGRARRPNGRVVSDRGDGAARENGEWPAAG